MPSYALGEVLWGPALGEVVAAGAPDGFKADGFKVDGSRPDRSGPDETGPGVGELVEHSAAWREYAVVDAAAVRPVPTSGDRALPDPAAHLSQGFAAWLGVTQGAEVRAGDTVFVSGAAGGVGSLAGQFARLRGAARVIGSTGSERKAEVLVKELGYDAVVLRGGGAGPIEEQLREAAPDGLDAVVDNVGGEQLAAALSLARDGARVGVLGALAGQVSGGTGEPFAFDSFAFLMRAVTMRGVRGFDHMALLPEWQREFGGALRAGTVTFPHVRLRGIEQAPRALCELLEGRHLGAVLVEL